MPPTPLRFGVLVVFLLSPSVASLRDFTLGYVIPPAMRRAPSSARPLGERVISQLTRPSNATVARIPPQ